MKKRIQVIILIYVLFFSFNFINLSAEQITPQTLQYFIENQENLNYAEDAIIITLIEENDLYLQSLETNYHFEIKHLYQTTYIANFDSNQFTMHQIMTILHDYPQVKHAEPNYYFKHIALPTTEPLYAQQWAYTHNVYGINIVDVWDETLGDPDITVAIIDTGSFYTHVDFVRRIWTNSNEIPDNGIDDDGNGYIDDYYGWDFGDNNSDPRDESGHGTFVAGIVAGAVNDWGITGTAPGVKMMGLKVENEAGEIYLHSILSAVNYALNHNIRVFNMSFVSTHYSIEFKNLLESANAIFICGAGNDEINNDVTPYYPASYDLDNVISVASINSNGQLSWFSNYGPTSVHIAAPGENILSTWIPKSDGSGHHALGQGTSFSAPYVTGVAALLLSKDPDLTPQEVRAAILNSAKKITSLDGKIVTGGILDAYAAYTFYDEKIILGDLNGDEKVSISDLIILRRHLAVIEELDESYLINADVNQDGFVTISDLIKLRRYLAELEEL